jgi:hypothetical protein
MSILSCKSISCGCMFWWFFFFRQWTIWLAYHQKHYQIAPPSQLKITLFYTYIVLYSYEKSYKYIWFTYIVLYDHIKSYNNICSYIYTLVNGYQTLTQSVHPKWYMHNTGQNSWRVTGSVFWNWVQNCNCVLSFFKETELNCNWVLIFWELELESKFCFEKGLELGINWRLTCS